MDETRPDRAFGLKLCVGGLSTYLLTLAITFFWYQVFIRFFDTYNYDDSPMGTAMDIFQLATTVLFFAALFVTSTGAWIAARPEHPRGSNVARLAGLCLLISGALPMSIRILSGLADLPRSGVDSPLTPELMSAIYLVVRITGTAGLVLLMAAVDTLHRGVVRPTHVIVVGVSATLGFWLTWLGFEVLDVLSWTGGSTLITGLVIFSDLALAVAIGIIIFEGLLPALKGADSERAQVAGEQTSARGGAWSGVGNIAVGGLFIAGGASGTLVLRGTDSSGAIAALGGVLIVVGLVRMAINHRPR